MDAGGNKIAASLVTFKSGGTSARVPIAAGYRRLSDPVFIRLGGASRAPAKIMGKVGTRATADKNGLLPPPTIIFQMRRKLRPGATLQDSMLIQCLSDKQNGFARITRRPRPISAR